MESMREEYVMGYFIQDVASGVRHRRPKAYAEMVMSWLGHWGGWGHGGGDEYVSEGN
jgi:hypothetical protein